MPQKQEKCFNCGSPEILPGTNQCAECRELCRRALPLAIAAPSDAVKTEKRILSPLTV